MIREMSDTPSISDLPEGCVTDILSMTSPRDACRSALISKAFHSAADSDAVWERFLPPDYREIIGKAVSPVANFSSKKQLYHRLSDSYILLDNGYLGLKLDKESGKKCYMLGAKALSIVWSDDNRYWEWGHVPESRFAEVGILKHVWWLDISGKLPSHVMLSRKTTYGAYLVYRVTRNAWGLSGAGKTIVSFGGIRNETPNVLLQQLRPRAHAQAPVQAQVQPHAPALRNDGWLEIELGEFYCDDEDEGVVGMAFEERRDHKGGLIVEGIELRPK